MATTPAPRREMLSWVSEDMGSVFSRRACEARKGGRLSQFVRNLFRHPFRLARGVSADEPGPALGQHFAGCLFRHGVFKEKGGAGGFGDLRFYTDRVPVHERLDRDAEVSQVFGPGPLHVTQIVRVVNHPAAVRVLIVDLYFHGVGHVWSIPGPVHYPCRIFCAATWA